MQRITKWIKDKLDKSQQLQQLRASITCALECAWLHFKWILEDITLAEIIVISCLVYLLFHMDLVCEALCVEGVVIG